VHGWNGYSSVCACNVCSLTVSFYCIAVLPPGQHGTQSQQSLPTLHNLLSPHTCTSCLMAPLSETATACCKPASPISCCCAAVAHVHAISSALLKQHPPSVRLPDTSPSWHSCRAPSETPSGVGTCWVCTGFLSCFSATPITSRVHCGPKGTASRCCSCCTCSCCADGARSSCTTATRCISSLGGPTKDPLALARPLINMQQCGPRNIICTQ
jgi:hypothetical protein